MSKRNRRWKDCRKTKKQKTNHGARTKTSKNTDSSISSTLTDIIVNVVEENPGKTSTEIGALVGGLGHNLKKTFVRAQLLAQFRGGILRREGRRGSYVYYTTQNRSLGDIVIEIVEKTPGKTSPEILRLVCEKCGRSYSNGNMTTKLIALVRDGKLRREGQRRSYVYYGTQKTRQRKPVKLKQKTRQRKPVKLKQKTRQRKPAKLKRDLIWDLTTKILKNIPGCTAAIVAEKLWEMIENGEVRLEELTKGNSQKTELGNLKQAVAQCFYNRSKTNIDLVRRKKEGHHGFRYYLTSDDVSSNDDDDDESDDEDDDGSDEDDDSTPSLTDFILETISKNQGATVKLIVDELLKLNESELKEMTTVADKRRLGIVVGSCLTTVRKSKRGNTLVRKGKGGRTDRYRYYVVIDESSSDSDGEDEEDEEIISGKEDDENEEESDDAIEILPLEIDDGSPIEFEDEDEELTDVDKIARFKQDVQDEFTKINQVIESHEDEPEVGSYLEMYRDGLRNLGERVLERITGNGIFELS